MYRSNTLQKTDYLQIYQCQFPTAGFNFNHFHSCSVTDHVLLLYILCIDLPFSIPNRIQSVPFHAFYWSCFTSLYIVHLCKKKILCYRNGADQTKKNDRGETPYDLAVKGGYDSTVKKFASAMGSSQLKKMVKPKTTIPAS